MSLFFKKRNKEEAKTENKEVETEKKMTVLDMKREYNYYNAVNDVKLGYPEFVVNSFGWAELDRILAEEYNSLLDKGSELDIVLYDFSTFCKKEYRLKVEILGERSRKYIIHNPKSRPDCKMFTATISYE